MSLTSQIGALFFKHHQAEGKKPKRKSKRILLKRAPLAGLQVRHAAPSGRQGALVAPAAFAGQPSLRQPPLPDKAVLHGPLRPHFDGVPDDLPVVAAPPPGTPALEEADTVDTTGLESHGLAAPGWCSVFCCRPCE